MWMNCNRGKTPGRFGDRPYRSAFGCQKPAELRALRSDGERMLHLRARTFAPITMNWRRDRDSNPGYACTYTRFPSVRLKPLGHLSVIGCHDKPRLHIRMDAGRK